jgi:ABC-2 type transport system permease protein
VSHGLRLMLRQIRYENRSMRRNPASSFFTAAFPLIFLVVFTTIFGNSEIRVPGGTTTMATFYVASIAAYSVINACYTNVAMNVSFAQDLGQLKRLRGTPLPAWALLGGKIGHAVLVGYVLVVIVALFGWLFYGVDLPLRTLPAVVLALTVGAGAFAAIGLAVASIVPNADAAPAVVNGVMLPLTFISDIFIPMEDAPSWLTTAANLFPLRHLALAVRTAFNPFEGGYGFELGHVAVVAAWGLGAAVFAARYFRWEPKR